MISRPKLEEIFQKHGLVLLGQIALGPDDRNFEQFQQWLSSGKQAGMDFLTRNQQFRRDASLLEEGLEFALVFCLPYNQEDSRDNKPKIAKYARMTDYHKSMKKAGDAIVKEINGQIPGSVNEYRITIDSAPILERALASKTLHGFIGKNTLHIHPDLGSYYLIGEILSSSLVSEIDQPLPLNPNKRTSQGGCGTCKRCQINCPTNALSKDYTLDANKCLSYWTIEHRGTIPLEFWPYLAKYWFGCDICQDICPYNRKKGDLSGNLPLKVDLAKLELDRVVLMDQAFYESTFGGTPLTRAKKHGLQRNALIALTVTRHPNLDHILNVLVTDPDIHPVLSETISQIELYNQTVV